MRSGQTTDREFQAWVQRGELRRAGEWLVHRYAGEVLGLCGAMVRDRQIAEDLAQDVFGRAFASLGGYRAEASPRTWVLTIARNRCIDYLRSRTRDPWGGHGEDTDPDHQAAEAPLPPDLLMRRADVEQALASLSEGERALVVLRYRHGLDYAELAAAFGLREGTARMRVSRALARMREQLVVTQGLTLGSASDDGIALDEVAPARSTSRAPAPRRRAPREAPPAQKAPRLSRSVPQRPEPAAPPAPARPPPRAPAPASASWGAVQSESGPPASSGAADGLAAFLVAIDPGVPSHLQARLLDLAGRL